MGSGPDRWQDVLGELRHCDYLAEASRVKSILDSALAAADAGAADATPSSVLQQLVQARQAYDADPQMSWQIVERVLADVEDAQAQEFLQPGAVPGRLAARHRLSDIIEAAEGEEGARQAGVPQLLTALLAEELLPTQISVVRPTVGLCSRCGSSRFLKQQISSSSFVCGHPAALYRSRSCSSSPDAASEWFVAPDAKVLRWHLDYTWLSHNSLDDLLEVVRGGGTAAAGAAGAAGDGSGGGGGGGYVTAGAERSGAGGGKRGRGVNGKRGELS
eukprot:gene8531-8713_t